MQFHVCTQPSSQSTNCKETTLAFSWSNRKWACYFQQHEQLRESFLIAFLNCFCQFIWHLQRLIYQIFFILFQNWGKYQHFLQTIQNIKQIVCVFQFVEIFHFVEIQSAFFYIFRADWNFQIKFCSVDPSFNRNILRSLYLKFKASAHVQTAIAHCYVIFTNFLTWHVWKLTLGINFDKWSWTMILSTWSR